MIEAQLTKENKIEKKTNLNPNDNYLITFSDRIDKPFNNKNKVFLIEKYYICVTLHNV